MELNLKLNKINKQEINDTILDKQLFTALRLKNEIQKKRNKFSKSLRKLKAMQIEKSKELAFKEAKKEILDKYFEAHNFYNESVFNANNDCLELSLKIANEIIKKEASIDTNIIIKKINEELRKLGRNNKYKILCNQNVAKKLETQIFDNDFQTVINESLSDMEAFIISQAGSISIDINNEFEFLSSKLKENLQKLCY